MAIFQTDKKRPPGCDVELYIYPDEQYDAIKYRSTIHCDKRHNHDGPHTYTVSQTYAKRVSIEWEAW